MNDRTRRRSVRIPYLQAWRFKLLISQNELATKVGLASTTLSKIENGKSHASFLTIRRIAAELGISPTDLLETNPDL
jgi:transcriptional regulator with XRE-family HTH domain